MYCGRFRIAVQAVLLTHLIFYKCLSTKNLRQTYKSNSFEKYHKVLNSEPTIYILRQTIANHDRFTFGMVDMQCLDVQFVKKRTSNLTEVPSERSTVVGRSLYI